MKELLPAVIQPSKDLNEEAKPMMHQEVIDETGGSEISQGRLEMRCDVQCATCDCRDSQGEDQVRLELDREICSACHADNSLKLALEEREDSSRKVSQ